MKREQYKSMNKASIVTVAIITTHVFSRRIFVGEKELLLADVLEEKRKNGKLTKEVLEQKRIISSTKNEKEKIQHEMIRLENEHQNQKSLLIEDVTTFKSQRDELQDLLDAQEKHLKSTHHAIDQ